MAKKMELSYSNGVDIYIYIYTYRVYIASINGGCIWGYLFEEVEAHTPLTLNLFSTGRSPRDW